MCFIRRSLLVCVLAGSCFAWADDAQRGADVLRRENCLACHTLRGEGGGTAPDLGRRSGENYTPPALASLMWNHGPAMWSEIAAHKMPRPSLNEADAQGLFAYLYSVRFFDRPGDAGRGKQLFNDKHCADCHSLSEPAKGPGTAVSTWKSISDPVEVVQQMWTHSSAMKSAIAQRKELRVVLTGQELTDLTVYLQNIVPKGQFQSSLTMPDAMAGKTLYAASCAQCHKGSLALERRLANMTLTDVGAAMWNHVTRMLAVPVVNSDDMRKIVAYVWEQQYLGAPGNAGRGRKTFEEKRCASCHDDPAFPEAKFVRGEKVFSPVSMIPVIWNHGPEMQDQMKQRNIPWPRLAPEDITNLVAYLNTRP